MKVHGKPYRSIWLAEDGLGVDIIDQTRLPHEFVTRRLQSLEDAVRAIRCMQVRGAPLIGATAAYGMSLGMRADATDSGLGTADRINPAGQRENFGFGDIGNWT